jgi:hypothetical protein
METPTGELLASDSGQPGTDIWLMIIMEMVKELPGLEALIAQPHKMIDPRPLLHLFDLDILG